jgi:hypothetical protein
MFVQNTNRWTNIMAFRKIKLLILFYFILRDRKTVRTNKLPERKQTGTSYIVKKERNFEGIGHICMTDGFLILYIRAFSHTVYQKALPHICLCIATDPFRFPYISGKKLPSFFISVSSVKMQENRNAIERLQIFEICA